MRNRQTARRISRWTLYQQNLTLPKMKGETNEDGAIAVPAAMAPWAMKNSVEHPYTHWKDSSDEKKTTEQSTLP